MMLSGRPGLALRKTAAGKPEKIMLCNLNRLGSASRKC